VQKDPGSFGRFRIGKMALDHAVGLARAIDAEIILFQVVSLIPTVGTYSDAKRPRKRWTSPS